MILEKTVELVKQIYKYHKILAPRITQVVIGLGYTGVEISAYCYEPFLGLAQTLPQVINGTDCSKIKFAGDLTEKTVTELLEWTTKPPSLEKIIGIATLNAVSQHILEIINPYNEIKKDLIRFLKINKQSKIIFIGFIEPMIKRIKKLTDFITIIDDNPFINQSSDRCLIKKNINELKEHELSVDVLFCSGTSLINNTLEDILSLFKRNANYIALIGPTVSFIPDILFDSGVDIVGGLKVNDSKSVLKVLQEGGGMKAFKQHCRKFNFIKD